MTLIFFFCGDEGSMNFLCIMFDLLSMSPAMVCKQNLFVSVFISISDLRHA